MAECTNRLAVAGPAEAVAAFREAARGITGSGWGATAERLLVDALRSEGLTDETTTTHDVARHAKVLADRLEAEVTNAFHEIRGTPVADEVDSFVSLIRFVGREWSGDPEALAERMTMHYPVSTVAPTDVSFARLTGVHPILFSCGNAYQDAMRERVGTPGATPVRIVTEAMSGDGASVEYAFESVDGPPTLGLDAVARDHPDLTFVLGHVTPEREEGGTVVWSNGARTRDVEFDPYDPDLEGLEWPERDEAWKRKLDGAIGAAVVSTPAPMEGQGPTP